jgi:hypothetical protein
MQLLMQCNLNRINWLDSFCIKTSKKAKNIILFFISKNRLLRNQIEDLFKKNNYGKVQL